MFTGAYFSTIRYDGFPTHQEIWKHLLIIYFADDLLYTFVHWAFHVYPSLYKYHKVHHEYDSVFSIMAQYCHPVEQLLGNLVQYILFSSQGRLLLELLVCIHSLLFCGWSSSYITHLRAIADTSSSGRRVDCFRSIGTCHTTSSITRKMTETMPLLSI